MTAQGVNVLLTNRRQVPSHRDNHMEQPQVAIEQSEAELNPNSAPARTVHRYTNNNSTKNVLEIL
jgi:hypothetical protein